MNEILLSLISTMCSLFLIIVVYWSLMITEKKRFFTFWIIGYVCYFFSLPLMLISNLFGESFILFGVYNILTTSSSLFLLNGTYKYLNKSLNKTWLLFGGLAICWSFIGKLANFSFTRSIFLEFFFIGGICIWTGIVFSKSEFNLKGRRILSVLFTLCGIHNFAYPFLRQIKWFLPIGYLIRDFLSLTIAITILFLYFIKTKQELSEEIIERKDIEKSVKFSKEWYELAVEGSNDGLWYWDLSNNGGYISPRCKEMLGYEDHELINHWDSWSKLIHPQDFNDKMKIINNYLDGKTGCYESKARFRTKNGDYKWILSRGKAFWDESGKAVRLAGSNTDISLKKIVEDSNHRLAYYDQLTDLPNRVLIESMTTSMLINAEENNNKIALMYMDLDNFKVVNDTLGHAAGDELLKKVGRLIENTTSSLATVARLGGDEFILVLSKANEKEKVTDYANEIIDLFNKQIIINERELFITTSIGIAMYPEDGKDFDTLSKNADMAMYSAKEFGKNRYKFFTKELNEKAIEKLELENSLRHAIENKELKVFYQPQVNLKTARIDGMEALVRWDNPEKGMISPIKFISLAEETGLIISIGNIVLYEACLQNKIWQDLGHEPLRVAVNLSAKQFEQEDLVEIIEGILEKTTLEPKWLELEITESTVMKNFDFSIVMLNRLRDMGIHVSLDDFGTGYSSLNYLKRLPIDTLKIDKSFVDNITQDSNDEIIAKVVIELAHKMGLKIVAEGVEHVDQLNFLKQQECDKTQGFLFSEPITADEFQKLIRNPETYENNKLLIFNEGIIPPFNKNPDSLDESSETLLN